MNALCHTRKYYLIIFGTAMISQILSTTLRSTPADGSSTSSLKEIYQNSRTRNLFFVAPHWWYGTIQSFETWSFKVWTYSEDSPKHYSKLCKTHGSLSERGILVAKKNIVIDLIFQNKLVAYKSIDFVIHQENNLN